MPYPFVPGEITLTVETDEAFELGVDLYWEGTHPSSPLDCPDTRTFIVPKLEGTWLKKELEKAGHKVSEGPVLTMADLPAEEQAEMRSRRGMPYGGKTVEELKAILAEMKAKRGQQEC